MANEKTGCLTWFLGFFQKLKSSRTTPDTIETFPYKVRDDFLTAAEMNFYRVLKSLTGDAVIICPKVSLIEIFYIAHPEINAAYRNRIDRKHVDFLLCRANTLKPLLAIELDDASHNRPDRIERDVFVENVFADAGLPLVRIPVREAYNTQELSSIFKDALKTRSQAEPKHTATMATDLQTNLPPVCPKCGSPMVLRTARRGSQSGKQFYGCINYPHCQGVVPVSDDNS